MSITLTVKNMTIEEKIKAMELLWNDLCRHVKKLESPAWHGDILDEREKAVKNGTLKIQEWNHAKKAIRRAVS